MTVATNQVLKYRIQVIFVLFVFNDAWSGLFMMGKKNRHCSVFRRLWQEQILERENQRDQNTLKCGEKKQNQQLTKYWDSNDCIWINQCQDDRTLENWHNKKRPYLGPKNQLFQEEIGVGEQMMKHEKYWQVWPWRNNGQINHKIFSYPSRLRLVL